MSEKFSVGQPVRWTSSNTDKTGRVAGIVPAGMIPADVGYQIVGCGSPRDHESYVMIGFPDRGRQTNYWPVVSMLRYRDGLTWREIAWYEAHAAEIR